MSRVPQIVQALPPNERRGGHGHPMAVMNAEPRPVPSPVPPRAPRNHTYPQAAPPTPPESVAGNIAPGSQESRPSSSSSSRVSTCGQTMCVERHCYRERCALTTGAMSANHISIDIGSVGNIVYNHYHGCGPQDGGNNGPFDNPRLRVISIRAPVIERCQGTGVVREENPDERVNEIVDGVPPPPAVVPENGVVNDRVPRAPPSPPSSAPASAPRLVPQAVRVNGVHPVSRPGEQVPIRAELEG
ncbi:hypothetical protein F5Y13DRAFT_154480 [Hypoxylon sp. FL1857]|nr:hypothetical protein F5Y13DRAFT_154480 [Hypoxylon sp. FL1857]